MAGEKGPGPKEKAMGTGKPKAESGQRDLFRGPSTAGPVGSTGTSGVGAGATGHPGYATEGQADRPVEPSSGDKARGVKEQHETSILAGQNSAARDAALPGSAGGRDVGAGQGTARGGGAGEGSGVGATSGQAGAHGSGSTVDGPATIGRDDERGTVGGTRGLGVGGPVPAAGPIADSPARGKGRAGGGKAGRQEEGGKPDADRATAEKSLRERKD